MGPSTASRPRRAGDDGVLVLTRSWVGYGPFSHWRNGVTDEALPLANEEGAADVSDTTLLGCSAGNDAMDRKVVRSDWGLRGRVQGLPMALAVGGTGGRDHEWHGETPWWMPDATARPYERTVQADNLDRSMIDDIGREICQGTGPGYGMDLAGTSDTAARLAVSEYGFDGVSVRVDKNGPDDWMGEGRLNVARAVEEAQK